MSQFEVVCTQKPPVAVLEVKGYLDAHTAPQLEREFEEQIAAEVYRFVVNFKDLTYISSAGLGVLMQFIEHVRENDGDIKLSNMSPRVYNVFDLLGFPMLYEIFNTEEEAIQQFQNKSDQESYTE